MACKVFVSYSGSLAAGKAESLCKQVADALGICCEDVVIIPAGIAVAVVEVPCALITKRDLADMEAKTAAEKAAREAAELAEAQAIKEALIANPEPAPVETPVPAKVKTYSRNRSHEKE